MEASLNKEQPGGGSCGCQEAQRDRETRQICLFGQIQLSPAHHAALFFVTPLQLTLLYSTYRTVLYALRLS